MIDKPLYENPLAGGGSDQLQGDALVKQIEMRMAQRDVKSPAFNAFASEVMKTKGYPTKTEQEYNTLFPNTLPTQTPLGATMPSQEEGMPGASGSNIPLDPQADMPDVLGPQLIDPGAEARRKANEEFLKTADEYQRGFRESEFYKPGGAMTTDMAEFTYSSPTRGDITMKGSSSGIGQFGAYLDSIGKGDLLQRAGGSFSQDLLGTVNPNDPSQQLLDGTRSIFPIKNERGEDIGGIENTAIASLPDNNYTRSVQPIVSGPEIFEIATQQAPMDSYNRVGQQIMGPNQDEMLGTLKNIEQGIASLVGNYGQDFNLNKSSNYGDFDNFGIGSFFPPYGGMYG
jgi:hypothetical protein